MARPSLQRLLKLKMVSEQRRQTVLVELLDGVQPSVTYYLLLGLATLIASCGLLASSTAVVIGAMLVSPLMTPMFGVAVGVTRGDLPLIGRAMRTVFSGTLVCLGLSFILGLMPFALEVTSEMIARTRPTLLDLLVAASAGFAACLTWIDERVSPVLPGVAIATSLVPPLATSGLLLAMGGYWQSWGAFLLFFANFVAIVAVSATVFVIFGFVRASETESARTFQGGIWGTVIALVSVGGLLTYSLVTVMHEWTLQRRIESVIEQSFADDPNTALDKVVFRRGQADGSLYVLSTLRTPRVVSPVKVRMLEDALESALGQRVAMHVRCVITRDVAPMGVTRGMLKENLDGTISRAMVSSDAVVVSRAEQLIREYIAPVPGTSLNDIFMLHLGEAPVIVAEVTTSRAAVAPLVVNWIQERLREYTSSPDLRLLVRAVQASDITADGKILLGDAHFYAPGSDRSGADAVKERVQRELEAAGAIVDNVDVVDAGQKWIVRGEVVGVRVLTPRNLEFIEQTLERDLGKPVGLTVFSQAEALVNSERLSSLQQVIESGAAGRMEKLDQYIRQLDVPNSASEQ